MKKISLLGSTGSIGTQTLEVIENLGFELVSLSFHSNEALGKEQILKYKPKFVSISNEHTYEKLIPFLDSLKIKHSNEPRKAILEETEMVVNAVVGSAGLMSTVCAIEMGKKIALANKESLVCAGKLINELLEKNKEARIYPIDSEHSAIWQCFFNKKEVKKIILTASGGPFREWEYEKIKNATFHEALKHPNWVMGNKITIDSATLMNKALEVIEAYFLFSLSKEQIEVIVHPQSIVHSMVEYRDGQVLAQLGSPDMRLAIGHALTYPNRLENNFNRLNFVGKTLTFEKVREEFKSIDLSFRALEDGGTMPAVLNAANEACVEKFLNGEISFLDIQKIVEMAMNAHEKINNYTLEQVLEVDKWAKKFVYDLTT
ncbi:MAG: 1-deoxy-D-xylulose-5-phosphate reductoisomerase [Defluviitaleaceae bacterium]|nr:1-deoxy-D-xylulose-5-phosphate reductoisomerase [Defluviitaleaceae bacterium]